MVHMWMHGINISIKEPTCGYVKGRESLYTLEIVWVSAILNLIDTKTILPRYQSSWMVCENKHIIKYPYHTSIKNHDSLETPKWYKKKDDGKTIVVVSLSTCNTSGHYNYNIHMLEFYVWDEHDPKKLWKPIIGEILLKWIILQLLVIGVQQHVGFELGSTFLTLVGKVGIP